MGTSFQYFVKLADGNTAELKDCTTACIKDGSALFSEKDTGYTFGFAPGEWLQFYWGKAPDGPDAD